MNGYLLDTHIWVWAQRKVTEKLTQESLDEIEAWQRAERAFVSPFSTWELALLENYGQVDLGGSLESFVSTATEDGGLLLTALTPSILIASTRLPGELHHDPADRILAATARELGLTLVTRDKTLLSYAKQGHLSARKP